MTNGMNEVKVKTSDLLAKLEANRDSHAQLYKDAVEGYKVESTKRLQKALADVEKGKLISSVRLSVPRDHTAEYDQVIAMLEMSVEDEITLTKYEFDNYVLDNWVSHEEKTIMRAMALSSSNAGAYK